MKIGSRIKQLRLKAGMTQEQLARKLNLAQPLISRLESATYKAFTLRTLVRVAEALDAYLDIRIEEKTTSDKEGRRFK